MALPILDGNQSATTLSSILTSGEHIPAHTVVSLGTQAITDISAAVSGSVVSISNFPATQPVSIASVTIGNSVTIGSLPLIAGTVTANLDASGAVGEEPVPLHGVQIGYDNEGEFRGVSPSFRLPVELQSPQVIS